jgi:hypothetical protein
MVEQLILNRSGVKLNFGKPVNLLGKLKITRKNYVFIILVQASA